jgi:hypothetical protein
VANKYNLEYCIYFLFYEKLGTTLILDGIRSHYPQVLITTITNTTPHNASCALMKKETFVQNGLAEKLDLASNNF